MDPRGATLHRSSAERPGRPLGVHQDDKPADRALRVEPMPGGGFRVVLPSEGILVERINNNHFRVIPAQYHVREERTALVRQLPVLGQGHAANLVRSAAASSGV